MDKVYSNENNNLFKELPKNYPKTELNDRSAVNLINEYIHLHNEEIDIKNAYANMQYIIVYLADENNERYDTKNTSLYFIVSVLEKNNYIIEETLKNILFKLNQSLYIEHILFLHEKFEIQYFNAFTNEIKNKLGIDICGENTEKVLEYFKQKHLLLNEEVMKDIFKKYILRYCLGNYRKDVDIFNNIDIESICQKNDLFPRKIIEDRKFKKEINKLIELNENKKQNYVIQYCFKKIFEVEDEEKKSNGNDEDDYNEDEEEEYEKIINYRRKHKRI